jgi:hypothetical protein
VRGRAAHALAAAALLVVAGLGAVAFLLLRPADRVTPLDVPHTSEEPAPREVADVDGPHAAADTGERTDAGAAITASEPGVEPRAPGTPCVVAVRTEEGAPVPGAFVLDAATASARRATQDDAALLGVADVAGDVELPAGACGARRRVAVTHAAFLATETTLTRR